MSKQSEEKPKIVVEFDKDPLLRDLGFDTMISRYKSAAWKVYDWNQKKTSARAEIFSAVESVAADTVEYAEYKSTIVRPSGGSKLDLDKLKENLMKMGKLDALTVAKIFAASLVPGSAKAPYVRISAPTGVLPKSKREEDDE